MHRRCITRDFWSIRNYCCWWEKFHLCVTVLHCTGGRRQGKGASLKFKKMEADEKLMVKIMMIR